MIVLGFFRLRHRGEREELITSDNLQHVQQPIVDGRDGKTNYGAAGDKVHVTG